MSKIKFTNPIKCPLCDGKGRLAWNFYMQPGEVVTCAAGMMPAPARCRACDETGIVWEREEIQ